MHLVRLATEEDWPAMTETFRAAGQAAWGHILDPETLAQLNPPSRWLDAISLGQVLVVEDAQGFAVLRPSDEPSVGEIDAFYTHPSVWGKGLGRALMAACVDALSSEGFKEATLWTEVRNERPRRFYESLGWSLDGTERQRDIKGSELVELRYRFILKPRDI